MNTLMALALIALAGGAELDLTSLRKGARILGWATLVQSLFVVVLVTGTFLLARPIIPFARSLGVGPLVGVALLWGALAVTRSPSATLGILSQTKAQGPLATFTLGFVMASDIVVVVLVAMVARPRARRSSIPQRASRPTAFKTLGHELFGSVALGTTLGLFIAAYLRLVNRQMLVVLLALGFGVCSLLDYLHFVALLSFMVAGFIVRNMSRQGHAFVTYDRADRHGRLRGVLRHGGRGPRRAPSPADSGRSRSSWPERAPASRGSEVVSPAA